MKLAQGLGLIMARAPEDMSAPGGGGGPCGGKAGLLGGLSSSGDDEFGAWALGAEPDGPPPSSECGRVDRSHRTTRAGKMTSSSSSETLRVCMVSSRLACLSALILFFSLLRLSVRSMILMHE